MRLVSLVGIALMLSSVHCNFAQQIAFPEAEGHGKYSVGGRFGKVYEVTNLNDNGTGSLREGISKKGARIIVFRVSGTIFLNTPLRINRDSIYIAGQSAPGDGICIAGNSFGISASHVIIRYLRIRCGDKNPEVVGDAFGGREGNNIIIDHCSVSWSIDETASFYENKNFTMQWCIISESLYGSHHPKGHHGFGGIWGGENASFHHNLIAHHSSRNPRFSGEGTTVVARNIDFRNNVLFNWGYNSIYGGEAGSFNIVANYFKPGPATQRKVRNRIVELTNDSARWYIDSNYVSGDSVVTISNWNGGVHGELQNRPEMRVQQPFPYIPIKVHSASEAYEEVISHGGASLPKRDSVDIRIINELKTGFATYEGATYRSRKGWEEKLNKLGIIDSQNDVGGWPLLLSTPAPIDSDHDGMPDEWEAAHKLDPLDPDDRNNTSDDGYTMIEKYLNGLVKY